MASSTARMKPPLVRSPASSSIRGPRVGSNRRIRSSSASSDQSTSRPSCPAYPRIASRRTVVPALRRISCSSALRRSPSSSLMLDDGRSSVRSSSRQRLVQFHLEQFELAPREGGQQLSRGLPFEVTLWTDVGVGAGGGGILREELYVGA